MNLVQNISEINEDVGLLIGNFDGVHLGHQKLISDTLKDCEKLGLKLLVVSFVPHPIQILKPKMNFLINTYEERRKLLDRQSVDFFYEVPFDRDLSTLGPGEFLDKYVFTSNVIKKFYLGYDFAFGANKEGNSDFVEKYCKAKNISFSLETKFTSEKGDVSSSIIRKALEDGDINLANFFLNRDFFLQGRIIKGEGRGKKIGFPTANLDYDKNRIAPKKGVYITQISLDDMTYQSVTNIGNNPTFNESDKLFVETYIFDFDRDIYGETLKVIFKSRLRNEEKFTSVNKLVEQIKKDVESARKFFKC